MCLPPETDRPPGQADSAEPPPPGDVVIAELVGPPPRPWGFWATVGLSVAVLILFVAIQTGVLVVFALALEDRRPGLSFEGAVGKLQFDGTFVSLATLGADIPCLGLLAVLAGLRPGWTGGAYLGFVPTRLRPVLAWLFLFLVLLGGLEWLGSALERPVPEFMTEAYRTASFLPLLWLAIVVVAPLFEETFFRGFMFRGIESSVLGKPGAVVLCALVWTGIHAQYDLYNLGVIFVVGIMIGIARAKTGSIIPPLLMHATMNGVSMIQLALFLYD
jgi:membrane protease YdiL (CAAX protease family)